MNKIVKYGFIVSFIWAGFVLAISFMEAWVKFRAESLEFAVGLDVGQHVFGALNMVERFFAAITLLYIFIQYKDRWMVFSGFVLVTLVVAQSGYLLPELNEHAQLIMQGMQPEKSSVHKMYVLMEVVKVVLLFFLGIKQVNAYRNE